MFRELSLNYCVSTIAGKLPVWPSWVSTSNSISRLSFWKCWIAGLYYFLLHFVLGFSGHLRNMTIWWLYYRFLIGTGVLAGTFYHCSLPQSHLRGLGNLGTNNVGYIIVWFMGTFVDLKSTNVPGINLNPTHPPSLSYFFISVDGVFCWNIMWVVEMQVCWSTIKKVIWLSSESLLFKNYLPFVTRSWAEWDDSVFFLFQLCGRTATSISLWT